eukprot:8584562-Alexandrium_andersonii.AAC.1
MFFLARLAARHAESLHGMVRSTCLWSWCEFQQALDDNDLILPRSERKRAVKAANAFLLALQYLAAEAQRGH